MPRKTKTPTLETPTPHTENTDLPTPQPSPFAQEGELVADVFETKDDFMVVTAIAGVQIKDLDIAVENNLMVIKGDRVNPHHHPNHKYFAQECYWGPFSKKIILPENLNTDKTDAQINKGILTIRIPKLTSEPEKLEENNHPSVETA